MEGTSIPLSFLELFSISDFKQEVLGFPLFAVPRLFFSSLAPGPPSSYFPQDRFLQCGKRSNSFAPSLMGVVFFWGPPSSGTLLRVF